MTDETPPPPDDEFRSERVRTLADMRRATDDRVIAGVCTGAARYLNIDPVVLRIALVVLTFAGLAGPILYLAAWFLLPEEGAERSIAADWFNLDANEPQVRAAGLLIAAALAVGALVSDAAWDGDWVIWPLVPLAIVYWVFVVRPRRKREKLATFYAQTGVKPAALQIEEYKAAVVAEHLARHQGYEPRPKALVGLTMSAVLIAVAVTWLIDLSGVAAGAPTYLAVALAVVGLGLLIGTFLGYGGPLIAIGLVLALALGLTTVLPTVRVGDERLHPTHATELDRSYEHGAGRFELNLTGLTDLEELAGRTINVDMGIGETVVLLPEELPVHVIAHLDVGQLTVFGRQVNGHDNALDVADDETRLTLRLNQHVGNMEVVRE